MRSKGTIFIGIGTALLIVSLGFLIYNLVAEKYAKEAADQVYEHLRVSQQEKTAEGSAGKNEEAVSENLEEIPDYILNPEMDMPTMEMDGNVYIGVLKIPSLELDLPIMNEWSYAGLKIAPGRYAGSVYTHDIVIAAHNYTSHFGKIKNLSQGDPVVFTDIDGNIFNYRVLGIEILGPRDTEKLLSGEGDLMLFTCTIGGAQRVTVRCALENTERDY